MRLPLDRRHRRTRRGLVTAATLTLLVAAAVAGSSPAAAASVLGGDVSWPNCPTGMGIAERPTLGLPMPLEQARFVVLGLTNGPAFSSNPCLASQVSWATSRRLSTSAYAIVNYPTPAQLTTYGGGGTTTERLRRVGAAQAAASLATMRAAGLASPMVWVDVEPVSARPWSTDVAANNAVIDGALAGYAAAGIRTGLYSYSSGWNTITGGRRSALPTWVPAGQATQGAAEARCGTPSFSGGRVLLGQWTDGVRDHDVLCPGTGLTDPALWAVPARSASPAPRDLWATLLSGTGTGGVEVHALSAASGYRSFSVHSGTAFGPADPADWRFFLAPYAGSGRPDLYGVKLRGDSGRVEVHVLSAASGYREFVAHVVTAHGAYGPGAPVDVALASHAGSGGPDLLFVDKGATGSGTVEVHALSAASAWSTWVEHAASALPTPARPDAWRFLVGDAAGSGDLVGVLHAGPTGSGRSEVHVLSRASSYRSFTAHVATPAGLTDDATSTWALGDADGDGERDVVLLTTEGTGTGTTEVHALSGRSGFSAWSLHTGTGLGTRGGRTWQLGLG